MIIQINGHSHAEVDARKIAYMQSELETSMARFADHIGRIEVHFSDENSTEKKGGNDIRCLIEARLHGKPPVNVEVRTGTVEMSFRQANEALHRRLESMHGKEIAVKRKSQRDANPKGQHP